MRKSLALLSCTLLFCLGTLLPAGLLAQDPGTPGTGTYAANEESGDNADWGWLGLLGLVGLAGLSGRGRPKTNTYNEVTTTRQ